jgi:hypothetical protein
MTEISCRERKRTHNEGTNCEQRVKYVCINEIEEKTGGAEGPRAREGQLVKRNLFL